MTDPDTSGTTVARRAGVLGELALVRRGDDYEIVANGVFVMATHGGASERRMIDEIAVRMPEPGPLLIGGLGVGHSAAAAVGHDAFTAIVVVEIEPAVVEWNRGLLAETNGDALASSPRLRCVVGEVRQLLAATTPGSYAGIALDVDNGPDWLVSPDNASLYEPRGLEAAAAALRHDGVLAIWSAAPSASLPNALGALFGSVDAVEIPTGDPRLAPDVVYLASGPDDPVGP